MSEVWVHKKQLLRWMCLIVLLLISNIAFMVDPQMMKLNQDIGNGLTGVITLLHSELRTVELSHVLSMIFLAFLYNRKLLRKKKDFCFTASIVGAVFSGFLLVGMSLEATADFDFIFGRKCQMIIALLVFLGFWSILYTGLKCIYEKLDVLQIKPHIYQGILRVIDCHFLIISIIVLLICWLIMALAFFPGSIPHDGRNELNMYFGITPLNLHHPYFSTMIMGTIYKLGYMACGITGGCILYVVFQSVLGALIFGMICNYVYRKSNLILFGVLSVMYFGVVPVWWSYMQAIMKDGLYVIMFAWFILEYIKTFFGDNGCYGLLRLILSAISVCILRNGAGFIVLPALLVLIFLLSDKRKWMITVFVIVCVANHGLNTVLMDELGLKSANQVEALSIPLQQMARYVTLYENEVTEEEKQIIDKIVAYEGIPDRYNPECSDPIKDRYRNTNEEEWKAFGDYG